MRDVNLIVIDAFNSGPDAELMKNMLEAAGIDAMIQADDVGGMRPHVAWASGGYKLLVREEDAEAAREMLEPRDSTTVDDEYR